ncbi:MAG: PilZ domain-containing protein [Desulfatibacillum sp.]|nr:PilZ domain-containing protein [Desulfatibacillum sp.]
MKERRRHTRVDSLNLLAYTSFDSDGDPESQGMGRTLNVSESGILLETNEELGAGHKVVITIAIEENLVEIRGFVIRSLINPEGMYESGIRFADVSDKELDVLKSYIVAFEEDLA